MKSATFNINSVNRRLPNLLGWLRVCLQELKATNEAFPAAAISSAVTCWHLFSQDCSTPS